MEKKEQKNNKALRDEAVSNVHNSFGKHSRFPFDLIDINGININSNKIGIAVVVCYCQDAAIKQILGEHKNLNPLKKAEVFFLFIQFFVEKKLYFPGVIHSIENRPSVSIAEKEFTNKILVTQRNNEKCPNKNCRAFVQPIKANYVIGIICSSFVSSLRVLNRACCI